MKKRVALPPLPSPHTGGEQSCLKSLLEQRTNSPTKLLGEIPWLHPVLRKDLRRGSLQLEKVHYFLTLSEVEKLPVTYVSFPMSGKGMNTDKMGKV